MNLVDLAQRHTTPPWIADYRIDRSPLMRCLLCEWTGGYDLSDHMRNRHDIPSFFWCNCTRCIRNLNNDSYFAFSGQPINDAQRCPGCENNEHHMTTAAHEYPELLT